MKSLLLRSVLTLIAATAVSNLVLIVSYAQNPASPERFELTKTTWVKDNLQKDVGKVVVLRLRSGQDIEGKVVKVGDQAIHLDGLVFGVSDAKFSDAAVKIDEVSAIIVKDFYRK